MDETAIGRS